MCHALVEWSIPVAIRTIVCHALDEFPGQPRSQLPNLRVQNPSMEVVILRAIDRANTVKVYEKSFLNNYTCTCCNMSPRTLSVYFVYSKLRPQTQSTYLISDPLTFIFSNVNRNNEPNFVQYLMSLSQLFLDQEHGRREHLELGAAPVFRAWNRSSVQAVQSSPAGLEYFFQFFLSLNVALLDIGFQAGSECG